MGLKKGSDSKKNPGCIVWALPSLSSPNIVL